jgi:predicted metal-dependent hydrolase
VSDAPARVIQGGRAKAYRPLDDAARDAAFRAGIAAYDRGDFFEAHEHLEPAWMGTADIAERELHQGLIKLAAAYVHAVRGNPLGMAKNLAGARERLAAAVAAQADPRGLDLPRLLADVDARLGRLQRGPLALEPDHLDPPTLHRRTP